MTLETSRIGYVDAPAAVEALATLVGDASRVAIDTEADSLHHYFEKVCLIQVTVPGGVTNLALPAPVAAEGSAEPVPPPPLDQLVPEGIFDYLVDPLATSLDLSPLFAALARVPLLILHGADYDLRMLRRDFDFVARRVFDTMSAAQLLGYERFSYAALVERHCGIVLDKQGQKADWSRRPIAEKLITYAAGDTHYLFHVADCLAVELDQAGRLAWHEEICDRLLPEVSRGMREPDLERQWRIKGWHTLRGARAQGVLRELWHWRDSEAQRADLPPFKVINNETLVALATWASGPDFHDDSKRPPLPRTFVGRRLRAMLDAVERARALSDDALPKPLAAPRRGDFLPIDEQMLSAMKKARDAKAAELKIDPGVLMPGAALQAIALARPNTVDELFRAGDLYNWQRDLLGEELLAIVDANRANPIPELPGRRRGGRR